MKIYISIILILLFSFSIYGQENTVRTVVLGDVVEIVPQERDSNTNFQIVNILMNGKVVKKFSTEGVTFPQIIGTFSGFEGDFVLYRTDMGSGACAGGSLYIIKFNKDISTDKLKDINTSPILTTCLGEYPVFNIAYNKEAAAVLTIAGFSINLDYLNKWIENKHKVDIKKSLKKSKR